VAHPGWPFSTRCRQPLHGSHLTDGSVAWPVRGRTPADDACWLAAPAAGAFRFLRVTFFWYSHVAHHCTVCWTDSVASHRHTPPPTLYMGQI
jgi:hypothetical protein